MPEQQQSGSIERWKKSIQQHGLVETEYEKHQQLKLLALCIGNSNPCKSANISSLSSPADPHSSSPLLYHLIWQSQVWAYAML